MIRISDGINSLGTDTTTSGTYQLKCEQSIDYEDGDKFMVLGTMAANISNAAGQIDNILYVEDSTFSILWLDYLAYIMPRNTSEYYSCFSAAYIDTTSFGSGTFTAGLYYARGTAGTLSARGASLSILKLYDDDYYAAGAASTSSTSPQDAVTLPPFTLAADTTFDIIATGLFFKSNTTANFNMKLVVNGTDYQQNSLRANDTANIYPWSGRTRLTLAAGAHTISIQQWVTTSGTVSCQIGQIFVLNVANFQNTYEAESVARSTTTNTAYQDKLTLTQVPQAGPYDHIFISTGAVDKGVLAESVLNQTLQGATVLQENLITPVSGGLAIDQPYFHMSFDSLASDSLSFIAQYKSLAGALVGIQDCVESLWQTGGASVEIRSGQFIGGVQIL